MKDAIFSGVGMKYADDYDRATVECFRKWESNREEELAAIPLDDAEREAKIRMHKLVNDIMLYFRRGDRAESKAEYVRKRIESDRKREALLESAQPRTDIPCLRCQTRMVFQMKMPESSTSGGEDDRVLLIYFCPNECVPGRAFYDNGGEWRSKPTHCEKCRSIVKTKSERKRDKIFFTDICDACGDVKRRTLELLSGRRKATVDERYAEDRARFCMTDEELSEYMTSKFQMKGLSETVRSIKERKENAERQEDVVPVRMLRVMELQTVITESLEKTSFVKVALSDPAHDNGIRVKVTAFDNDATRTDDASLTSAKEAIESALRVTNWVLVKGSLNVTLGALSGELKGYTNAEEVRKRLKF